MMFDKMDTNKDGYIDKDEAAKMRKMHGHRHGNRGYGERSSYGGDRSGYGEDRSGYGGGRSGYDKSVRGHSEYGERAGDYQLPHMKPMGDLLHHKGLKPLSSTIKRPVARTKRCAQPFRINCGSLR